MQHLLRFTICLALAGSCIAGADETPDQEREAQLEIREAVFGIKADIESSNIQGLQDIHLLSEKFTKFGPRNFERQDVSSTNASEAAFFGSISDASYQIRDLKIDVFGDIGIATYYPEVSFTRNGEKGRIRRQTDAGFSANGNRLETRS